MIILLWLIYLFVSIIIFRWIIISAINSSELTKEIRELKEILMNQASEKFESEQSVAKSVDHIADSIILEETVREDCPACGKQVLSTDKVCGSCGLTLMDDIQE
jgi:predicted RNA-binding Zn-ribbon protein involved in translation (DUF1610 family)